MNKKCKHSFFIAGAILAGFLLWTVAIRLIDVQAIGPEDSCVGFATLNKAFHSLTGTHMALYTITDWLGLVPFAIVLGFALLGLCQWGRRKSLKEVDTDLLLLGGFYLMVMAAYLLFEVLVINYRPILIEGRLEASYPSSTTMLTLCVMPTTLLQLHRRFHGKIWAKWLSAGILGFTLFMVMGRLLSGVHWITDIIGGALLSADLVMLYYAATHLFPQDTL